MTYVVFTLVLFGALFHACWNTLIKLSPDKALETAFMNLAGSFLALPALIYFGLPDQVVWPYLIATLLLHVIYYYSLAEAYRWGDMSLTYPIMRGVAPLILVLISIFTQADHLMPYVILGIVLVSLGVIFLGITPNYHGNLLKAISFALLNGFVIAAYTLVDGLGVRGTLEPFSYIATFMFVDGFIYSGLLFHRRSWPIVELKKYCQKRWRHFSIGGIGTISSYGIALWAMTVAPIGMVSALREVSVLFALIIACFLLKEKINLYRWLGVLLVGFGAILIKVNY